MTAPLKDNKDIDLIFRPFAGLIHIPASSFFMGTEGWGPYEAPRHAVHLDDFFLDETLVTNRQFAAFVSATGYVTDAERRGAAHGYNEGTYTLIPGHSWRSHAAEGREEHPVVLVSWNDANAYAQWAGQRLPTEAEWEKAARGGLVDALYPWGDDEADGTQSNFAKAPAAIAPTTPVRQFEPNGYGLYDMVGNTWQWCQDGYEAEFYTHSPYESPKGPENGDLKVRRGGSWNVIQPFRLRCANRGAARIDTAAPNMGFRCALDKSLQIQVVENVLDTLRPAMGADGGGVDLVDVQGGTVLVRLTGMCLDCPSVSMTLKLGIEKTLRERICWFQNVERVLD